MIVPFAAGGGTDVLARIIAQDLNNKWGQPVIVENQPGASGAIGTRAVMKAAPDGYTLLMASTGALMAVSAGADDGAPFDVDKSLSPIVIGAAPPYLLVVRPDLPVNSTADLIKLAKEKPEGLTYGSSGVGAASHLSGLLFASATGIKLLHVPYKGTGPAVADLLGNRIDLMFAPGPVVQQFVPRASSRRLASPTPNAPNSIRTFRRCPMPCRATVGRLVRPAGAAAYAAGDRQQLNEVIVAAMQTQQFRDHLATLGAEPTPQTPEQFGRYINADVAKWSKLVKDNDVQLPGGK